MWQGEWSVEVGICWIELLQLPLAHNGVIATDQLQPAISYVVTNYFLPFKTARPIHIATANTIIIKLATCNTYAYMAGYT